MSGMDSGPIIKWQIDIADGAEVPFERNIYSIGLRAFYFKCPTSPNIPKVLHVCTEPNALNGTLWIGSILCGSCVRSICTGGSRDVSVMFGLDDVERYMITLSYASKIGIRIYDEEGISLVGTGHCLFDVVMDNSNYQ